MEGVPGTAGQSKAPCLWMSCSLRSRHCCRRHPEHCPPASCWPPSPGRRLGWGGADLLGLQRSRKTGGRRVDRDEMGRNKGRRLGEREERKRVIMALIIDCWNDFHKHSSATHYHTRPGCVCACVCVCTSVCIGSQKGIPLPNVDDSFMWFGTSEHYQSVSWETQTASFFLALKHKHTDTNWASTKINREAMTSPLMGSGAVS